MVLGGVADAIGGVIGALAGTGAAGKLEKLTIMPLDKKLQKIKGLEPIEVLFNPTALSIAKPVNWREAQATPNGSSSSSASSSSTPDASATSRKLNAPEIQFGGGGSRTLTLELLFDVTEPVDIKGQKQEFKDVRMLTNKIVNLTRFRRIDNKEEDPPVCRLSWGETLSGSDFPFDGVITNLTQNFTLFGKQGNPLRATLSIQFREYLIPENDKRKTDPEFTTRVVVRGDTVSSIAADVYLDPKRWRAIADANGLDDPRRLAPGQRLNIPKLL
ncbi:LysM peptidoglycan-binding domain-containing protein [Leptolyngbya sp. FACHB-321]|uniref:CIS tube protein n=1 Tax=Leptolyngbya sp. FACHB-321 TaxID=2692807 RepID=UPI0018EFE292|nr:LysM peptidoglycan-binding domain-containing protein [Leptolyngbya sp. FACHB-321]